MLNALLHFIYTLMWILSPPCEYEDSTNCYWDASEIGTGTGTDFVSIGGVYGDPGAHILRVGETTYKLTD